MDQEEADELRRRLIGLKGSSLVETLADELAQLRSDVQELRRDMEALEQYSLFAKRLELLSGSNKPHGDLPRHVEITATEHLLPRDGFYALEYATDGTPFRWTGPERTFSFNIYIERRQPLSLTLDALNTVDPSRLRNIEAFVDGAPLQRQIQPTGDGFRLVATLEPREGTDATQLLFITTAASASAASEDKRRLGIAFTRLSLLQTDPHPVSRKNSVKKGKR